MRPAAHGGGGGPETGQKDTALDERLLRVTGFAGLELLVGRRRSGTSGRARVRDLEQGPGAAGQVLMRRGVSWLRA
jgi:hypothetical protein